MEQWTNSNNRHTVTDGSFAVQMCRGCTVDHKKKIHTGQAFYSGYDL